MVSGLSSGIPALQQKHQRSLRPTRRESKGFSEKGKQGLRGKMSRNFASAGGVETPELTTAMKLIPSFLLVLTASFSLTHAEDSPKQRPDAGGPGREKMREMILQKFDANKNGTLDPDEKAAAMKAMQERRGGSPKGGTPGSSADSPKGGGPMQAMLLQKFDANKNGTLDPDEKVAAMKAMQERKGKSGGFPGAGAPSPESGTKFRRPPEAPKEGDVAKK